MNGTPTQMSSTDLGQHWMAWLALRHFLPARLLRELISIAVRQATKERLSLESLFEEVSVDGPLWNECWAVRPRSTEKQQDRDLDREYYVRLVRSLVWQNEEGGLARLRDQTEDPGSLGPELLDAIVGFGSVDLSVKATYFDDLFERRASVLQGSFRCLLGAFRTARENHKVLPCNELWRGVGSSVESVPMPLRAVMVKHVADLCADADSWDRALVGYDQADEMLAQRSPVEGWADIVAAWRVHITGSRAAALAITGADRADAARLLAGALHGKSLEQDPVAMMQLSFDALVTSLRARPDDDEIEDRKLATMVAPLLLSSHDPSAALGDWLRRDYDDAHRRFWGLLRRQIALGAGIEARATKVWYARSLLDELFDVLQKNKQPRSFELAARMLVESGNADAIGRIPWREPLLAAYVDDSCIQMLIQHAGAHAGSRIERELTLIALFKEWVPHLSPSSQNCALRMWRHVAALAKEFPAQFESHLNVGGSCLEALRELAEKRPELRSQVNQEVQEAICERLRSPEEWWTSQSEACKTADAYADAFDAPSMARVIVAVLDRLKNIAPETDLWPVTRPALTFLVSTPVTEHVKTNPEIGKAIIDQILRLGMEQESEQRMVLYYLRDFDPALLEDPDVRSKLSRAGIVEHVRALARQITASSATDAIKALLLVPAISGRPGLEDAFESLKAILDSASSSQSRTGLAHAYDPLLLLLEERESIEQALPEHLDWLRSTYQELLARIPAVWQAAAKRPAVLAPWGLPRPTKAHPVVVHNWAFASLRFAEAVGSSLDVEAALWEASANAELAPHIRLARATRAGARRIEPADIEEARAADAETFYAALGRRLAQLKTATTESGADLCKVLVQQCLRFGPRDVDAAVLMEAARFGLHDHVRASGMRDYETRLQADRDRRLILGPILLDVFGEETSLLPSDLAAQWADGRLPLEVPR
jgi:hypothetical protein